MKKQMAVRTYPKWYTTTIGNLNELLQSGYTVAHITQIGDGITEYIVEKEIEDKK